MQLRRAGRALNHAGSLHLPVACVMPKAACCIGDEFALKTKAENRPAC
ncbi:hypothetical protein HMPREF9098_0475 [Kingella denitrificans ATCC 33394]|uniref:Uncharacterized protein n=1 Tax=Kingella denitrificans ATCC 33394 TaxID=888741 RepID=F0EX98_9NEIS|nr:hypothetical protein HMPREF9098_0475 [Kingella denitrificans ATCC 33394]